MDASAQVSRRRFLAALATAGPVLAGRPTPSTERLNTLRTGIVTSPVGVAMHRARIFTEVFGANEKRPFIVRKALATRRYFETVPLYVRPHDRIAGSISETPGAMPLLVELGIGENNIYTSERPDRRGYLKGKVPPEMWDYWLHRNMWGMFRAARRADGVTLKDPDSPPLNINYKFISNQGHLSPSYAEVLRAGLGGVRGKVREAGAGEFLEAAGESLAGLSVWIVRYAEFLAAEAKRESGARAADLREMSRIARKVSADPPETFREALQLIWFIHQAVHIEGHGYSCTPDHIDQLLLPYYESDRKAGRIDDAQVLELAENFTLKMYDNTFWGPEHHLTQGLCVGGSTPDGRDLTNRLSWLFLEGATNLALPEPLVWIRWHEKIDQEFFDFSLTRIARSTCFPMMWNDRAIVPGLMALGVSREDAFRYIPVGCNELGVPGQFYFNPGAHCNYIGALNQTLNNARGLASFEQFVSEFGGRLRAGIRAGYDNELHTLKAQFTWGVTPLTSCFFEGCVEKRRDMSGGTKYNILSCGGVFFANAVDALAAIREVVYRKKLATLEEVAQACQTNFKGHEKLRAQLLAAPKHGNDDPRLDDIIRTVERLRDEPVKEFCRDPRDGTFMGNGHVVRSSAVRTGSLTGATPDGRLAGAPLATSIAASVGCERSGPTALLNSVCKVNGPKSWQTGYQVNIRFQGPMLSEKANRDKVRAMLNAYFLQGGQELQINCVDTEMLRAAQKNPGQYRDLVVRVAGFSEFFVNLTADMQEEIIARAAHS